MENPLKGVSPKQKKVLVVVGVGAAAYVAYRWFTSSGGGEPVTTVTSGTDEELAGTGIIGSNVGGSENVGNSSNTGADEIDSNTEWFSEAVDRLANGGRDAGTVQSALGAFLTGKTLNSSEADIVRAAVGAMGGYPPGGPMTIKETSGGLSPAAPAAPTGLKVINVTDTTVSFSWTPVPGARMYWVYRSGAIQNVTASSDARAVVDGLKPSTEYTLYVSASNDVGVGSKTSPRSQGLKVKTKGMTLKAPTGLKVSNIGRTSARLTWTGSGSGEYLIRRSGSSATWESVDAVINPTGLKPRTKYSYQVAQVQPGTRTPGPWSSYVTFTTKR